MNNFSHIFMIGIGGIGVSALARYFVRSGKIVAGYDRTPTALTAQLESEGIKITFEDKLSFTDASFSNPRKTLIIFTPAVKEDNGFLMYFRAKGFKIMKRAEVLGEITKQYKTIAVAGTHGKTSVSCMMAHLLYGSGVGCTAILGGIPANYKTNFLYRENTSFMVTEADEFDRSFLKLHPCFAVITSADADHLDVYGDKNSLVQSFNAFAGNVSENGVLLVKYGADINTSTLKTKGIYSYSLNDKQADVFAGNIKIDNHRMVFDLLTPDAEIKGLEMKALGLFNVENAVAAAFMAIKAGVSETEIRDGLLSFEGVYRRFQRRFVSENVIYIDDYAHHPEEIKALIASVKSVYPGRKITGIFQPHLYSRTRDFADGFAESLALLDEILLLDIYPARELPIENVNSNLIFQKIKHTNKLLINKEELPGIIKNGNFEILLTIGAGDIDRLIVPIREILEKKYKKQQQS